MRKCNSSFYSTYNTEFVENIYRNLLESEFVYYTIFLKNQQASIKINQDFTRLNTCFNQTKPTHKFL
jgi:hypothetical protein